MTRKTIEVVKVLWHANYMLRRSTSGPEVRRGVCNMIELVLHAADAYSGFGYLSNDRVPEGHLPGIDADLRSRLLEEEPEPGLETAWPALPQEERFPDPTRRVYYVHHKLYRDYRQYANQQKMEGVVDVL